MYSTVDSTKEYISFYATNNVNFLQEKSQLFLACIFKKISLFKSVSESVKDTQVRPTALKTVASHPIAVKPHLDVMNIGVRTPSHSPEKKIKSTHGCTVSFTRYKQPCSFMV